MLDFLSVSLDIFARVNNAKWFAAPGRVASVLGQPTTTIPPYCMDASSETATVSFVFTQPASVDCGACLDTEGQPGRFSDFEGPDPNSGYGECTCSSSFGQSCPLQERSVDYEGPIDRVEFGRIRPKTVVQ